jgi:hypothetical protein
MIASISLINSDTNEWSIQISDATTGQVFSRNVVYNSTRSSGFSPTNKAINVSLAQEPFLMGDANSLN